MLDKKKQLELLEKLPTSDFVHKIVGNAMDILEKTAKNYENEEEIIEKSFNLATKMAEYAKKVSKDDYYKYSVVVAGLLYLLPKDTDISDVDTKEETVKTMIKDASADDEKAEELGAYKSFALKIISLLNDVNNKADALALLFTDLANALEDGRCKDVTGLAWLLQTLLPLVNKSDLNLPIREEFDKLVNFIARSKF
jgi:hypothetical protein